MIDYAKSKSNVSESDSGILNGPRPILLSIEYESSFYLIIFFKDME